MVEGMWQKDCVCDDHCSPVCDVMCCRVQKYEENKQKLMSLKVRFDPFDSSHWTGVSITRVRIVEGLKNELSIHLPLARDETFCSGCTIRLLNVALCSRMMDVLCSVNIYVS